MSNKTKFIINTSVDYFDAISGHEDHQPIVEFLETDEITVLAATTTDGKLKFHHQIPNDDVCLLFYKIPKVGSPSSLSSSSSTLLSSSSSGGGGRIGGGAGSGAGAALNRTPELMDNQSLGMLTLEGGMVKSIYNSMSRVFSPHAVVKKAEYSPELSGLLESLHVSLGSTLGLPQSGIASITDEIKYWKQKLDSSKSRVDREMSQVFIAALDNIDKQIRKIDPGAMGTVEEFLDAAHNSIDELWRLPYRFPQVRMADLLDILGNLILEICTENLSTEDIWNLSSYHVTNSMSQCHDIVDSWIQLCDSLTRLFWPNYVQHVWTGEPHIPKRGQLFKERLAEIKSIKNLFKQIVILLDDDDIINLFTGNSIFKEINVFDTTEKGRTNWNKALNQFEQILQPIDEKIAFALKAQLHNYLSNARQIIFIFSKYETLIQRPAVLELLTIEREQFVQSLQILLQDLRKAMNDTNMEPDTGHMSVICNECRWLKVVQYQITEIERVSHLISGREGYDQINKVVQEIKEETESLLRTNFEIWCGQCMTAVKSGELRLRDDQPVVKFEKEGRQLMRVTFNPKLVTFCQDVREFENLGYTVPIELKSSATHAAKFMCYARRLQQIATFHNTIGDRMIPCQRPIMLKNAMELSRLVQAEPAAWNDEESVQSYVSVLQTAVSKLSADNNLLVGYHEQAKRTIVKLMNTDLFTQGQVWKDEMRHLRELVASLERQNYTNLDAFKLHWDHQLYKVLEYQYLVGITDMNNKLPDIHIDIMFRQRQLVFRPTEEEIREKYFTQLRRFLERPCGFRGLSEKSTDLFKNMVEINRNQFGPLFKNAEDLFAKLAKFKMIWKPWIALGCVDIEELCSIHLNSWDDWDRNFKACKHFSQKVAKLQNSEEQIDCFVINILPLRSDIEFISRRYWEVLSNSLRTSILNDVNMIQEFLQGSMQFLQNVPMDEATITESGMKYEKMTSELPKINTTIEVVKGKDTCLAGWCKERVSALASILQQWEKLQPLIENHAVILQRQVDIIKDQANSQIQNLHSEAEKFILRWESTVAELEANKEANLDLFKERYDYWSSIKDKKNQLIAECSKFNMEFPEEILQPFEKIDEKVQAQSNQWKVFDDFSTELDTLKEEEWAIYRRRPYALTEFLTKWESSIHSSIDLPSTRIRQMVERLQTVVPVLQILQSDALSERHWAKICMLLNKEPKPMQNIILKDVLENTNALVASSNEIGNIAKQASAEQVVRQALNELDQWAVTATLKLTTHNDSSGNSVSLIKDYQEILNKIGDNQSLLQSAKNSSAFDAFSDQAELWESRLNSLDNLLTGLNKSQRRWVYLEPVFGAGTLKNEEALFKRIDKDFRYVMREIQSDSRVISIIKINNITTIVNSLENQLSRCQNNLTSYIMDKRNSFPRFYFLGDDDLLEILGQASKEEIIQKHIRKLFPGCHSLNVATMNDVNTIKAVHSAEGDILTLGQSVQMKGPIENWLNLLVTSIQDTLKEQIVQCYAKVNTFNDQIIATYPVQVLSIAKAVNFTAQAERAIGSMSLQKLLQSLNEEIAKFAKMKNLSRTDSNSDSLMRTKLRALLFDLVHYVTIVEELLHNNVTNVTDWHWLQQMKFYLDSKTGIVMIKMVYAEFEYSYEFLGNPNQLVSTSLTHKCYLILTQAMHMGLGGNPFGPAGTGKTECVKALGAKMGRLVLVFNCDENIDSEAMGLILTGLARCGAWGCFDEFNRLQEATLSAISMLIQPIQIALKEKSEQVQIAEKTVNINHHCGIFVTLNPAGEEYGGRQKLPGNIQALFRPIVMQQPEPKEISRVMLFVEGFKTAHEIGDRIVELFDLCKKMLSTQRHYDWGLRELKTILLACGSELSKNNTPSSTPNDAAAAVSDGSNNEMEIVVQCLRANTMSKLTQPDTKLFDMLLQNVFPEIEISTQRGSTLMQCIAESFATLGMCPNDRQIEKALQLHEQLVKRMGVVVVGPPGSGKTSIINVLRQALVANGRTIRTHTISPKSMSRVQLLGKLDADTRQWTDGVLTTTAVAVNSEPSANIQSWIICDGSIDPEWIEALNSVLDDNKLLTLPSGWRIQFGNNVNFIFETHEVTHASPATISRMGIVNLSSDDLPKEIILDAHLAKEEYGDLMRSYCQDYFEPAVEWVEKEYLHSLPSLARISLTWSLLTNMTQIQSKEEFCICLLRSISGFLPVEKHNDFANYIFELSNVYISNPSKADLTYYNPERDAIEVFESDFAFDSSQAQLIRTDRVKSYLEVLRVFLEAPCSKSFLIAGPSGCGKTLLIQEAISEHSGYELNVINCSKQLTPAYILHTLKQSCVTVTGLKGREYKPRQVRVVLFFKNLDLCHIDAWGTSEIVELILQLVQRNGFYADNLEWINISGIQICGSISDSNSRLKRISPRFLTINHFLRVSYPSPSDMESIVQNRLEPILMRFKNPPNTLDVVRSVLDFFTQIQESFNLVQGLAHYQFTPKIIMNFILGLSHYPVDSCNEALICELVSIFKDRLATEEDIEKFDDILRDTMRKFYGKEKIFFIPKSPKDASLIALAHDEWMDEVQRLIAICSSETFIIDEPITKELLDQSAKIARVISRPNSHLMIIAQPSGRHLDAMNIASTQLQAKIYLPQGVKDYNIQDFYNDLKLAMQTAALEDQCTCLLIDHCWITYLPDIMKPIEAILEGSEILDLFGDDLDSIASSLKHSAQLEGYQDSMGSYFIERTKRNLHLVLVLDPTSDKTNEYFDIYPALYRNMDFLYVRDMSSETAAMLPKKFIETLSEGKDNRAPVSSYFSHVLNGVTQQQSPKRYYQLIRSYFYICCHFSQDIDKRLGKLQMGVDKLASAHKVVATLKSNAVVQEEALAEKRKLANDALEMISATMRNANEQKSSMLELKKQAQVNSEKLKERQKAIQIELSEVEPILKEASAAVGQIKSEALSEIRSLRAPPEAIRDILEGVLRLMGIRDTSWNSMKTFLAKRGVKEDIRSLDPGRINPENCEAVEKLLASKADSFELRNAKRASAAAAPLATWVKASVRYSKVIQSIRPLEREQNELQRNLDVADDEMKSLMTGLDDVDARVKELSGRLNAYTQEAAVLELKLEEARTTLNSAEVLVDKLSSEFQTWSVQLDDFKQAYKTLDTKSLLLSFAINYCSHLSYEKRLSVIEYLTTDMHIPQFSITKNLLSDQEQIIWESMGLDRDAQVIENAALLAQMIDLPFATCPIPLVIDPSQTAYTWLQEYLRSKNKSFEATTQNNDRFSYSVELALRFGKILIVQDCQDLRPPLLQLVKGNMFVKFGKKLLEVGGKLVDLHENFKLVMFSKTDKLSIAMESKTYCTCIPFTVTRVGLTDQLISKTIILKNPNLEKKRVDLLRNEGILLKQRNDLEDKLLQELSEAQGDILKNEKLLKTLNEVKESSSHIDKSLKESAVVKDTVLEEYNQFQVLCSNAANFYIGLSKLYEVSPVVFTNLYLKSVELVEDTDESKIYASLVRTTFQYLARSTPRESHITLAIFVCKNAYPDRITQREWELFVTNFMISSDGSTRFALPSWMDADAVTKLNILLTQCPELETALQLDNDRLWRPFVEEKSTNQIPVDVKPFQKVLISQILRPDLIIQTLSLTASHILGLSIDSVMQPTMEQLTEESSGTKPILVITQPENDPSTEIRNLALKKLGVGKYTELSIGRGMEKSTLEAIRRSAETGKWICVKNVHLIPNWLVDLDRELETLKCSDDFRLWIICESTKGFSEAVMYKFVKVLFEFPNGLKNKVRRLVQQYLIGMAANQTKDAKITKLRVVLFILNSVLQERRKYIPQGWSKWYEFGDSDLRSAMEIIQWLEKSISSGRMNWKILQKLCENVAYGGRISNNRDLLVLQNYLEEFFTSDSTSNRWSPLNLKTTIPTTVNVQEYVNAVMKFPDSDEPDTFKLSPHSNVSRDIIFSRNIIKALRTAYYQNDENSRMDKRIRPILMVWKKLAGKSTVLQTWKEMKEVKASTPWEAFVISEMKKAGQCFQEVHNTLSNVHIILRDSKNISNHFDSNVLTTLAENLVPLSWRQIWAGPRSTIDYLKGLIFKSSEAERRLKSELNLVFVESINLSAVFSCETFLASLKLANSKKLQQSSKSLILQTSGSVSSDCIAVKIASVKVDGAQFHNGKLIVSSTLAQNEDKSDEFYMSFKKCDNFSENYKVGSGKNQIPLYSNVTRENLICYVDIETHESADTILLSGAALIVSDF
ncbi:cytoplasmic dynein 2 heavy chain 1 [Eupeodes corollae]|uniref:cytoplasmic dynein 2 heavy chain 1 n=1 Tax=Eupeodes corollae TaxID=290404 RepID=UPI002490E2C5|nr:cytoplasmic dynein 2 heavy chain 1 [Eupeodes corollae]